MRCIAGLPFVVILSCIATLLVAGRPVPSFGAPVSQPDYAKAYATAMRCVVFSKTNDDEARARLAFDAAVRLGQLQGLENARVNIDFDWAISRETKRLHDDPMYREQTHVDCRTLGWAQ